METVRRKNTNMYMNMFHYIFMYMGASRKEGSHHAEPSTKHADKPASEIDSKEDPTARVYRLGVESGCISVARLSQAIHEGVEPTV